MTTKVLIVNHGPDPILVRAVEYGPPTDIPKAATVLIDRTLQVTQSAEFYVHTDQQLLIGEKRG